MNGAALPTPGSNPPQIGRSITAPPGVRTALAVEQYRAARRSRTRGAG